MLKSIIVALAMAVGLAEPALAVDPECGTRNPTTDAGFKELAEKVANDLVKNPTRGAPPSKSWIDRYKKANKGSVPKVPASVGRARSLVPALE